MKAATALKDFSSISWRISIHAAREGGDDIIPKTLDRITISIHAAREGGDGDTQKPKEE